jgi:hypothetical protein
MEQSSGTRRIVSLVILLVLVLVLIRLTSDSKRVEKAAQSIGLLPVPNPRSNADAVVTLSNEQDDPATVRVDQTSDDANARIYEHLLLQSTDPKVCQARDVWLSLLDRIPKAILPALTRNVFAEQENATPPLPKSIYEELESWVDDSVTRTMHWLELDAANQTIKDNPANHDTTSPLQSVSDWLVAHRDQLIGGDIGSIHSDDDNSAVLAGLHLALDRRLLQAMVDQAPWESSERSAFVRSWQRLHTMRQWLQQDGNLHRCRPIEFSKFGFDAHRLRGMPIQFHAEIVRVDRKGTLTEPGFGTAEYQVLWVRPEDSSEQPVCIYAPEASLTQGVELKEKSSIHVAGMFLKRLAYASQRGSDVAPLIQAALIRPKSDEPIVENHDYLVRIHSAQKAMVGWSPPIDKTVPKSIVTQRLASVWKAIEETEWNIPESKPLDTLWTNPLLEVDRLLPEMELLTQENRRLPLSDASAVVRGYGQVIAATRFSTNLKSNPSLSTPYVYRFQVQTPGQEKVQTVWTKSIPRAWCQSDGNPLNDLRQPCRFLGLSVVKNDQEWIWSSSLQWALDTKLSMDECNALLTDIQPRLDDTERYLLLHGWDLQWRETIEQLQADPIQPLSTSESKAFFQLLDISQNSSFAASDSDKAKTANDLIESLRKNNKGTPRPCLQRTQMSLRVVRVTRVPMSSPSQNQSENGAHYYQLDCVADIGNRSYEIPSDKEPIVYYKEYPVTCVAKSLPDEFFASPVTPIAERSSDSTPIDLANDAASVWYPRLRIQASGWFYRFWSYKTKEISQSLGEDKRQIAPLVVVDEWKTNDSLPDRSSQRTGQIANFFAGSVLVLGAVGIWWYVRSHLRKRK